MNELILILGGTGKTGRRIARRLEARGVPIRIGSRTGTLPFDWNRPETWPAVLEDVGAVYVAYPPDLAAPSAEGHLRAFGVLAAQRGVEHVVLLSGRGEEGAVRAECALAESGVPCTVLRAAWFAQNFSEGQLLEGVRAGVIALPAGEAAEPFVDVDDVADVAVAALLEPRHRGRTYALTGPRLLTFSEAVSHVAAASKRPVTYQAITKESFEATLYGFVPNADAAFFAELFAQLLDGHNAHLDDGVQQVLGRPPRDFADVVRRAADDGAWA